MVYFIALGAALIGSYINGRITPTARKTLLFLLCIFMILIMGFRYKVGVDTYSYMHVYQHIPPLDKFLSSTTLSKTRFEPGYLFICCACKSFSNEFWPVQMVMSTITTGCIFIFLYRYCRNPFVGVAIFFILQWFYFSTEIMRESAAIGIFLLNYKNLQEKKWVKYYLFSLLSIVFHYSAIVIWFFPFTKWLKPNYIFLILCVGILMITPFVEKLNELLNIAAISGRINQYVDSAQKLNFNWRLAELFRSMPPVLLCLILIKIKKLNPEFLHMLLLQILFCAGAFAIPIIFSRFTNYTTLFVTVTAANLIAAPQIGKFIKGILISTIIISQSYYYYSMYRTWLPYVSIFYPESLPERSEMYRQQFFGWKRGSR